MRSLIASEDENGETNATYVNIVSLDLVEIYR